MRGRLAVVRALPPWLPRCALGVLGVEPGAVHDHVLVGSRSDSRISVTL